MYLHLLFVLAVSVPHALASESCSQEWLECGETFCCCQGSRAVCKNKNLTYIPTLPKETKELMFAGNQLKSLSAETFDNISVSSLTSLQLLSNGIENIHNETFVKFAQLQKLSLENNTRLNWSQLQAAFYSVQYNLTTLILDNTGLRGHLFDDTFDGLKDKNIRNLFLRHNKMKAFNEKAFYDLNLQTMDLSNNWIQEMSLLSNGSRLGHKTIEILRLSYNEFVYWPPWFCTNNSTQIPLYPKLISLDLRGNAIMVLMRKAWACLKTLKRLNLRENVIQTFPNDIFLDLVSLEQLQLCYMAKPVQQIEPKAFHNSNLKELYFDNNKVDFEPESDISYDTLFTYCANVTKLLLGYNNLRAIYKSELVTLLSPLRKLQTLHLEGAHLYEIPENLFNKFPNLSFLYLGENKITSINPRAFVNVTNIKVLYLNENKIKVVDDTFPAELQQSLITLSLPGNPFSCNFCDTENNTWFRNWIRYSKINFKGWPSYYKCSSPASARGTRLINYNPKPEDCINANPMIVAYASIGVFLFLFTVFGTVGYKGRWYIRYWAIKCKRKWICRAKDDPERQRLLRDELVYDAFVIYHDNDRCFIRAEISQFMENEHNYKLFIWDRDFTAGDQTVAIVVDNIYKSNHVIAVVSKNFLTDQWCDFQLAVSLDRQIQLKRNFLTLITLDDVDKKLLNKTWCVLLTKTTTAEWCSIKNNIRRKLFEHQILSNVPCMCANEAPRRNAVSINCNTDDELSN